jgi:flagellar biosynthesis regulator FlbT
MVNLTEKNIIQATNVQSKTRILLAGNQLLLVEKEGAEEKRAKKAVQKEEELADADKQILLIEIFVF